MDSIKRVPFRDRFSNRELVISTDKFTSNIKEDFRLHQKLKSLFDKYLPTTKYEQIPELNAETLSIFANACKYGSIEEWEAGRKEELKERYPEGVYYINSKSRQAGRQSGTLMTGREGAIQMQLAYERWFVEQYFETKLNYNGKYYL